MSTASTPSSYSIPSFIPHSNKLSPPGNEEGGVDDIPPSPADGSSTVAYSFSANQAICVSPWLQKKSWRICVRPRTGPQSAHLSWPAMAKLQAASVPIA